MKKLREPSDFDAAAFRLFGYQPKEAGESLKPYKAGEFNRALGIKISDYRGFYAEVAGVEAPVGPVTPATARLPIKPILAIRRTHRGNHQVYGLSYADGFFNRDKSRAWIRVDEYMDLLGDDYFERLDAAMDPANQGAADLEAQKGKRVEIVDPSRVGMSEKEKTIFDKVSREK